MADRLFSSLLRYWRTRRGHSQLSLALLADVSARHLSFLETGRSRPSEAMVLRLMAVLEVPMRARNEALRAAGCAPQFAEPAIGAITPAVDWAIERMLQQQEPYPLTLLSADYRVLRCNRAAQRVFRHFAAEPARLDPLPDMFTLLFDPALARAQVVDWSALAKRMLARLHREALQSPHDERLAARLAHALRFPGVHDAWRQPDFSAPIASTLAFRLRRDDLDVGFLTTLTAFSAPGLITLEELRIESYFPLDAGTREICERWAHAA